MAAVNRTLLLSCGRDLWRSMRPGRKAARAKRPGSTAQWISSSGNPGRLRWLIVSFDENILRRLNTHRLHPSLDFLPQRANFKVGENNWEFVVVIPVRLLPAAVVSVVRPLQSCRKLRVFVVVDGTRWKMR